MGADFDKLALVHIFIGFQLLAISMTVENHSGNSQYDFDPYAASVENISSLSLGELRAVYAFIIMAFILFVTSFLLEILMSFGNLKGNKIAKICACVFVLTAVLFIIIGNAIYGAGGIILNAFTFSTYIMSAVLGLIGGIFLILALCGVKSFTMQGALQSTP